MWKKILLIALSLFLLGLIYVIVHIILHTDIAVLNPKGIIATKELKLMLISTVLMLIIVIPVFVLLAWTSWKYRASNKKALYDPDWDNSYVVEAIWWGFPCLIVAILSYYTWVSSHELDPFKPLESEVKPLTIQVVALEWKWLFLYPEQKIATVNYIHIPEKTPIQFEITANAPMNSFWIPQLGGQIYAMNGMKTELHLMADEVGEYRGSSANLSGTGFAWMNFLVHATTHDEFNKWVKESQSTIQVLSQESYQNLAKPSQDNPKALYKLEETNLFNRIITAFQ